VKPDYPSTEILSFPTRRTARGKRRPAPVVARAVRPPKRRCRGGRTQQAETLLAAGLLGAEEDKASPLPSGTIAAFPGDADHTIRRCRARRPFLRIALLMGGDGWHVCDLVRAATRLGLQAEAIDFCRVRPRSLSPGQPGLPARGGGGLPRGRGLPVLSLLEGQAGQQPGGVKRRAMANGKDHGLVCHPAGNRTLLSTCP